MKSLKSNLIILGSVGLLFLVACNKGAQASHTNSSPASSPVPSQPASSALAAAPATATSRGFVNYGGYHFECLTEKKATGTHLYVNLQKENKKEPVPNAKVTAQVQLPNGKQQTLPLKYDAKSKYYAVVFPSKQPGKYPVKITTDINGVNLINYNFVLNQ